MRKKTPTNKLAYGVGINDADYQTSASSPVNWKCEYKMLWDGMMQRCYSERFHSISPTYIGCTVDDRWKSFMAFIAWVMTQDWQGKQLDKDILFQGNKVYGPDTCVFVTRSTNMFLVDKVGGRGLLPLGVCWHNGNKRYVAQIGIGVSNKPATLGYFNTPEEAHECWYAAKKKQAGILAQEQTDPRVAAALIARFP